MSVNTQQIHEVKIDTSDIPTMISHESKIDSKFEKVIESTENISENDCQSHDEGVTLRC